MRLLKITAWLAYPLIVMYEFRILFAGTPEFAATHLQALIEWDALDIAAVYTQPDRRGGRGKNLKPSPVKTVALAHDIAVEQPHSLKEPDAQARLASYEADLLVVVAYGLLLPLPILEAPRLGCINVHGSLLPRWRGAAPVERAIEAGDAQTGITIMQMDVGLDTGDMLLTRALPIEAKDTGDSLRARLATVGVAALIDSLTQFMQQPIAGEPQDDSFATYASKLKKDEALIDWQLDADSLERKIRAYHSSNMAYTWLDGQRLRIWQAEPAKTKDDTNKGAPGTILEATKTGILVACGRGLLMLTQLQLPGAKALPVAQLLNAKASLFQPGFRFSHASTQTE